ncbi:MAG: hypothetical protein KJ558_10475 [Gammaproteobacteria bacterium]|nr:hypothetical protein [Gammaproteobacteria bacterium]MBU1655232.1 hypothetical protein [Gammaproteobacteria bacterium]MBU1961339.1 hypothetical protein [Gammaproteobacteria bacterium]
MAPAIPLADWGSLYEGVKREQAQSGRSNNVSEVVRAEIAAGRASGPARPAEDVFDRLEAKYSAQAGSQQR